MKWLLTATFLALACFTAHGQTAKPTFEVASVKPATPLGPMGMRVDRKGGPGTPDPGTYTCQNCPVFWVMSEAYDDLQPWEYAGPDWVNNLRFDFAAKVPAGTAKADFRLMLRNLLAERFKLAAHREKKEMAVYELVVAKSGPKFRESAPKDAAGEQDGGSGGMQRDKDGFPILKAGTTMGVVPGHARLRGDGQTMEWLAGMLKGQLHGPVTDGTGLKGKYDFIVSWAFGENGGAADGGGTPGAMENTYQESLVEAIQSQLGLKLEKKKGFAEALAVDHMEKVPTAN